MSQIDRFYDELDTSASRGVKGVKRRIENE
jgi:hypothetical protein